MKKYKTKIITGIAVLALLAFAFWWGGNAPGTKGWAPAPAGTPVPTAVFTAAPAETPGEATTSRTPSPTPLVTAAPAVSPAPSAPAEERATPRPTAAAAEVPAPIEPDDTAVSNTVFTCTLSVRCNTLLANMDYLTPGKAALVPPDGVLLPETEVSFYAGESVFNILVREMKRHKIHLEFVNTPLYGSAYIEGIGNLYEFDCGEKSGWMYRVNGQFPNYGCSRYPLAAGDKVEFVYTCDLGADVGGEYAARNGA